MSKRVSASPMSPQVSVSKPAFRDVWPFFAKLHFNQMDIRRGCGVVRRGISLQTLFVAANSRPQDSNLIAGQPVHRT